MDDKLDRIAKAMAESLTRRQGLARFAGGLAAVALVFVSPAKAASHCKSSGTPCGKPGQGGCGDCCSKSFFCQISADTGRQCFCN